MFKIQNNQSILPAIKVGFPCLMIGIGIGYAFAYFSDCQVNPTPRPLRDYSVNNKYLRSLNSQEAFYFQILFSVYIILLISSLFALYKIINDF